MNGYIYEPRDRQIHGYTFGIGNHMRIWGIGPGGQKPVSCPIFQRLKEAADIFDVSGAYLEQFV